MASMTTSAGTSSRQALRAGAFEVSRIAFEAGRRLGWHAHPHACIAVIVEGGVNKRFARAAADARVGTVVAMPPEEAHEDRFGDDGASIVVVESPNGVDAVSCFRDWNALLTALRIARELAVGDTFSPLAVEGLALELAAAAARGRAPSRAEPWLQEAHALLHERFREPPTATAIAERVGVHPSHLARAFRARYGESLGGCARRLRLEWAARELVRSDVPLVCLAAEAGFVDQSHFTRAFRTQFGITPARYRAAHR